MYDLYDLYSPSHVCIRGSNNYPVRSSVDNRLCFPIAKRHNSPLASPRPLARSRIAASAGSLTELFVFAGWESHDDVRFAGSEGEGADVGFRSQGTNGGCEWCCSIPGGLMSVLDMDFKLLRTELNEKQRMP